MIIVLLEKRHRNRALESNIVSSTLDPVLACPKDRVPEPGLFAVVPTRLPSLAMVEIVVFNNKFAVEQLKQPTQRAGRSGMQAEATVTSKLSKHNVLVTDPPLIKAHRHAHQLHCEIGSDRDTEDVEELLLMVGVESEQRVRVFCEMVGTMVLPQSSHLVHQTMVPIEPKVEDDSIESNLKGKPHPVHVGRSLTCIVGQEDREHGPKGRSRDHRDNSLADANVGDAISVVYITIEVTNLLSQSVKRVHFVHAAELESDGVEDECLPGFQVVAGRKDNQLVESNWKEGVEENPFMLRPLGHVWNFVGFLVDGGIFGVQAFGAKCV